MEELLQILVLWTLGAVFCMVLVVVEWIGDNLFSPVFFRLGIPLYKRTIDVKTTALVVQPDVTIKKEEGKFKFSSDDKVYFLSRLLVFRHASSQFTLKATGTIQPDNKIDIVARMPVGLTVLLIFVIASGVAVGIFEEGDFTFVGWGFAFAFAFGAFLSYGIQKARMDTMVEELRQIVEENSL